MKKVISNHSILAYVCTTVLVASAHVLFAQCNRPGFVLSKDASCGAQILDTKTGETFWAVEGADQLVYGRLCSFDRELMTGTHACTQPTTSIYKLNCASQLLPCTADFAFEQDEADGLSFQFDAKLTDPVNQKCTWSFGDGSPAVSGSRVKYTFGAAKTYDVCLTVRDSLAGCEEKKCYSVEATIVNKKNCGKQVLATATNLNLIGELVDLSQGTSQLQKVNWFIRKPYAAVSEQTSFTFPLPQYGDYTLCASYSTLLPSGQTCKAEYCKVITAMPSDCYNPLIKSSTSLCPNIETPVCGCDGITYQNECTAMMNGVSTMWLGSCQANTSTPCLANYHAEILGGSLNGGFYVKFINKSSGLYNKNVLDFGDGSPVFEQTSWDSLVHFYSSAGVYLTNLSVWKPNGVVNSVSKVIITDSQSAQNNPAPSIGSVWPGDTDNSKEATVRDLFNIGLGYFSQGIPRPNAVVAWQPQLAPNWDQVTQTDVNYKYLDCDGNGYINELDVDPIQLFCQPLEAKPTPIVSGKPELSIRFLKDTITFDPSQQASVDFAAELYVGRQTNQVQNLYGLSLALKYPKTVSTDLISFYTGEQFFGQSNQILWLQKNHGNLNQLDLGFVRKDKNGINGSGRIAQINAQTDFIIIVDLIDRQGSNIVPITLETLNIQAIDDEGNLIELGPASQPDTLWIKVLGTSSSTSNLDEDLLKAYPNPVTDLVNIDLPNGAEMIELYSSIGSVVYSERVGANTGGRKQVRMENLPKGIYTLRVQTPHGHLVKEICKL